MAWPRALALLFALTACTSGSTPTAAPPSPSSAPSTLPSTTTPTATASPAGNNSSPNPKYRRLTRSEPLTGFVPISVSFVSTRTGWFLGRRGCGEQSCGVLLQTRDAGRTFTRRTAPPVAVAQVRFANLRDGWAFGRNEFGDQPDPGLWRTSDGGQSWRHIGSHSVPSLEVGEGSVWLIDTGEDGTAPELFRGATNADALTRVFRAPNRAATVVVGHGTAYVVAQSIAGPIATTLFAVTRSSTQQRRNPCTSDEARSLAIAAGAPKHLVAICSGEPSAGNQLKRAYVSSDDGHMWRRRPDPPGSGYAGDAGSVASTATSVFLTGFRNQINKEAGSGRWRPVLDNTSGIGFSYVGFTDDAHGVALGAEPEAGAWLTESAGRHWRRLQFR